MDKLDLEFPILGETIYTNSTVEHGEAMADARKLLPERNILLGLF
jgi:hypothetical protein